MAGILDTVNQRTQLVGQNRLELLLFKLTGRQRFGINVFKVKEVLQCPPLTSIPKLHHCVRGIAHIRGKTISVIDLGLAIGGQPIKDITKCFVIIAEYNRSVQGFLVESVERIVNINWEAMLPPPKGAGRFSYLTAVTEIDKELVEILDVEKILDEIAPCNTEVSGDLIDKSLADTLEGRVVLIADDSSVARNQINRALSPLGLTTVLVKDGKEALDLLQQDLKGLQDIREKYALLISDVEMPEMDGYTLTAEIRNNPKLQGLYVILHTSLSGVFNEAMVKKVGADDFIPKFSPDELAAAVTQAIEKSVYK